MSASPATTYPIRAVARLTGVPIDTLRAWERRYSAVTPERDGRERVYTDTDVTRLRLLHRAVQSGHAIGRAAGLSNADLARLLDAHASAPVEVRPPASGPAVDAKALTEALATLDSAAVDAEFSRLAATLPPVTLVRDVLMPAIGSSGDDWMHQTGRIAQEHLVSAAMRHLMGTLLRLYARPRGSTRLLFATPSGDRHELGLLGAAMLAASAGADVTYLGPDLPATEIVAALTAARANVVVLGLTLGSRTAGMIGELKALARQLPASVELWAGGPAAPAFRRELGPRARVLPDLDAYLAQLARAGHPHA
ncbi:MAG: MerR family transcriptional regulator [Limisphaerales bacterium]